MQGLGVLQIASFGLLTGMIQAGASPVRVAESPVGLVSGYGSSQDSGSGSGGDLGNEFEISQAQIGMLVVFGLLGLAVILGLLYKELRACCKAD